METTSIQAMPPETMYNSNIGFLNQEWAVAGTGEMAASLTQEKTEVPPTPVQVVPSSSWWRPRTMKTIFDVFVGVRLQIHVKEAKVRLDKDSKIRFDFLFEVQRYSLPLHNLLKTW